MKTNCWLILGTMLATTAVAQVDTNKLPEIPPPATTTPAAPAPMVAPVEAKTNAPAKKAAKAKKNGVRKKSAARAAVKRAEKKSAAMATGLVTLVPGPATVAAENLNLRGQAGLSGEVVGQVKKGDTVTVLSEITLDKPKAGEPAQWAKIALPADAKVWVDAKYVDATTHLVTAKKLNLRGGPGENYSVLGVIEKGAAVSAVTTKGDWMEIQTPASAFAFVAANYLKQEAGIQTKVSAPPVVAATESAPPPSAPATPALIAPTPTPVAEAPAIAPPAATPPPTPETTAPIAPPATPAAIAATPPAPTIAPATPATPAALLPPPTLAPEETDTNLPPPPPRIVTHEGMVRHSVSLVAPTYYELYDPFTDTAINYLYTSNTNLVLSRYNGKHITVTGEEGMDVRWKDTPVITIKEIHVLPPEALPARPVMKPIRSHK